MLWTRKFRIATKIFLIVLLLLTSVVALLHLALTAGGVDQHLRNYIEATLSRQLQREVQVGKITLSPFLTSLELRDVVVKGPEAVPFSQVDIVELYPDPGLLLAGEFAIRTVVVRRPVINLSKELRVGEGWARVLQSLLAVLVDRLQIREGELTFRTAEQTWSIRGLDADLWRERAQVRGEVRIAEGVLDLAEQSLRWGNLEALVVLTEQELVLTRLGIDVGDGTFGLTGRLTDPFGEPTLALRLTAGLPLTLPAGLPERIRLEGQLSGSAENPRFQGDARLEGTRWPDLGIALSADREGVRGERFRFLAAPGKVSGGFDLRWKDLSYGFRVRVKGLELDLLGRTLPVTGMLALQAVAEGRGLTAAGLMAQANFRVILLRRDRRSGVVGRADGLIKAAKGLVSLERLRVDLPPNRLTMKGSLWKEFNLQVAGTFPRVDQVGKLLGAEGLGGKGKVKGRLMGPHAAPVFRGALTWDAARLLGTDFKTIRGKVELQQWRMIAPRLLVTKGNSTGTIHLRLALAKKQTALDLNHDLRIEAEGQIKGMSQDLFSLFVEEEIPLTGRMTLDVSIQGVPARIEGRGHVRLRHATALGEPWQDIEADLILEPTRLLFEKMRLARGAEQLTGSGLLRFVDAGTNFRLATAGLSLDGFRFVEGTGLQGKIRGKMHGEGHLKNPTIRGKYTLTGLRYNTVPVGAGRGSFLLEDRNMTAQLALPKAGYATQGTLQTVHPYSYNVQVTMKQAELAPLFAFTGFSLLRGATGTGSGTVQVVGNLEAHHPSEFTVELEAPSIRIHGKAFHTAQPFRLAMREDTLTISSFAVSGDDGWLNAGGQIAYHGEVDVNVKGKIPLPVLLPRPGAITGVRGNGKLDLKISGLWKAPRYTGTLKVEGGRLRLGEHPELVAGVRGQVQFQGRKIHIPSIKGRWAGGKVKLSGKASRRRGKGWRWVVDLGLDKADAKRAFAWEEKGKARVTGRTDFYGKLTTQGKRWEELQRSLRGKLRLDLKEGKFEQYTVLANIVRILNLTPDPTTGVPYDHLKAVFRLRRGVAETQDLLFLSDTVKVGGVGKIDLGRGEVDMLLGVQPLRTVDKVIRGLKLHKVPLLGHLLFGEEGSALVVSMKVEGPLKTPQVSMVPLESLGRGVFGIFQRVLELPAGLFPAKSSRRREN